MTEKMSKMLCEKEVANWLGYSHRTLSRWRAQKKGPPYEKHGHNIRYDKTQVELWRKKARQLLGVKK